MMQPYFETEFGSIYLGNALDVLKEMPDESVNCCVTSPPYWGLRDYGTATWEGGDPECDHMGEPMRTRAYVNANCGTGNDVKNSEGRQFFKDVCPKCGAIRVDDQLGLEKTPEEYVSKMTEVFREVRRVLRNDGTLWLNLGDSYAFGNRKERAPGQSKIHPAFVGENFKDGLRPSTPSGLKPKDLVGIPWMVAFALRQPYYTGRIKDDGDRKWLAGLTDGEGCLTILKTTSPHGSGDSYPPIFQIRMCDIEPLQKAYQITGYGKASPKQEPPSQGGQHGSFQWRLSGRKAADIVAEIYPYLLVKRRQAIVIWNHQKIRDSYHTKRGTKVPDDAIEQQLFCRELIQKIIHRDPVDIPSWMEEPKVATEPGWYLRSDCIWHKPNTMPESVTDRPTKSHEYVFLLSKSERYHYDYKAIMEERCWHGQERTVFNNACRNGAVPPGAARHSESLRKFGTKYNQPEHRNRRSVWTVATQPFSGAHFATFSPALIEPCILAGCPKGGIVLDPFIGSGTTAIVAHRLDRKFVGIELSQKYLDEIAIPRIESETKQLKLFA